MTARACNITGCLEVSRVGLSRCPEHYADMERARALRGAKQAYNRRRSAGGNGAASRLRYKVRRKGGICVQCGVRYAPDGVEVDHIVPLWNNGKDDEGNVQLLCILDHRAKTRREAAERRKVQLGR